MRFKVGQEVVCIRGHVSGEFILKEGSIYTVKGLSTCGCSDVIHVGMIFKHSFSLCTKCSIRVDDSHIWWVYESRFAEIDTLTESESIGEELINVIKVENIMA